MSIHFSLLPLVQSLFLTCAFLIILLPNPVHSVLFLILLFCNAAGLLLLFGVEFLSLLLIIVYVGAIAVLFLFVVMMLDIQVFSKKNLIKYITFGGFILFCFLIEIYLGTFSLFQGQTMKLTHHTRWIFFFDPITNTKTLGQLLYTYYSLFLLLAGIILLIALIGAVVLTFKPLDDHLGKDVFRQQSRSRENAIFLIS